MKKLLQSELFVMANIISFIALFLCIFVIIMSDNYNPVVTGTNLPVRIMMCMMLGNFACLLCSIGSFESDRK